MVLTRLIPILLGMKPNITKCNVHNRQSETEYLVIRKLGISNQTQVSLVTTQSQTVTTICKHVDNMHSDVMPHSYKISIHINFVIIGIKIVTIGHRSEFSQL